MAEAAHSKWSASGFEQRMLCPGSHVLQQGLPNTSSKYAAEGTAAHQVLTWALQQGLPARDFLFQKIEADGFTFEVDEDMARHVQVTLDYVNDLKGDDGVVFADIRVNYASYLDTPEADAWGTADVIIARGDELIVVDFKYGMGVEVSAERNPQMSLYGLGARQAYQELGLDFTKVRLAISQPRIKTAPSEFDLTVEELEAWGRGAARSAVNSCKNASDYSGINGAVLWQETYLRPGEKQCKFCRAKATCPALRAEVAATAFDSVPATPDEFAAIEDDLVPSTAAGDAAWLAACLSKADLIEDWCKAVRAEVERRLLAGDNVPGYKLVQGKQGNRAWSDEKAAEALLKSMRLKEDQLYDFSVKSPTQIAKLGPVFDKEGRIKPQKEGAPPPVIGPRQWPKVEALITRAPAKKHVAPVSDSRPALTVTPVVDDFSDVTVDSLA
jgi:hypothetical protein